MQIPDYPFRDIDGPSFVHHSVIRKYLESYAKHFNLRQYVKVNKLIKNKILIFQILKIKQN